MNNISTARPISFIISHTIIVSYYLKGLFESISVIFVIQQLYKKDHDLIKIFIYGHTHFLRYFSIIIGASRSTYY
jgi:hypothetical protein